MLSTIVSVPALNLLGVVSGAFAPPWSIELLTFGVPAVLVLLAL
jgi:hypothetical protein